MINWEVVVLTLALQCFILRCVGATAHSALGNELRKYSSLKLPEGFAHGGAHLERSMPPDEAS